MLEKLRAKITEKAGQMVEVIKVPDHVREERLNICLACDDLVPKINMCNNCGCIVNAKTWIPSTKCPIDKWGRYPIKSV